MKKSKSLMAETFVFASILVLAVLLIVFSVLYLVLPKYYLNQKKNIVDNNIKYLAKTISDKDDTAAALFDFSLENNVDIFSYDKNGKFLPNFSTPFLSAPRAGIKIVTSATENDASETAYGSNDTYVTDNDIVTYQFYFDDSGAAATTSESVEANAVIGEAQGSAEYGDGNAVEIVVVQDIYNSDTVAATSTYASTVLTATLDVDHPVIDKLSVFGTLQPIDEASDVILSLAPILIVGCLIIGLIPAYWYSKKITKPILKLSKAAVEMQQLTPDIKSDIKSNNELGTLSKNLDTLYQKLSSTITMLEEETERAHALEQSKTQLMQSASHELKTPLAALNGITEGMIDKVGVYKNRDAYLQESKKQIDKLSALIQEILHASQSDSKTELILEEISLPTLINQLLEDQYVIIQEKNLTTDCAVEEFELTTDFDLLKRAVSNIVSNAVKYSPKNSTVSIKLNKSEKGNILSIANIADKLSPDELAQLTEPFYTSSFSRSDSLHGTGLGLYISKQNLNRLGFGFTIDYKDDSFIASIKF